MGLGRLRLWLLCARALGACLEGNATGRRRDLCEFGANSEASAFCDAHLAAAFARTCAACLERSIFVYTSPRLDAANAAVLAATARSEPNNQVLAEVALHVLIAESRYATADASEAELFFVPFYRALAHSVNASAAAPLTVELTAALAAAIAASPHLPHAARRHLIVAASANSLRRYPEDLREHAIALAVDVGEMRKTDRRTNNSRGVAIPYFVQTTRASAAEGLPAWTPPPVGGDATDDREFNVWFEGSRHTRNQLRGKVIPEAFGCDERNHIEVRASRKKTPMLTVDDMLRGLATAARSRFCLAPSGDTPASRRPYEAIAFGCAPVVVSARFVLPYASWLRYDKLALRLSQRCLEESPALARAQLRARVADFGAMRAAIAHVSDLFLYDRPAKSILDAILTSVLVERIILPRRKCACVL